MSKYKGIIFCALLVGIMSLSHECSQSQAGRLILPSKKRKSDAAASQVSNSPTIVAVSSNNGSAMKISLATSADDGDLASAATEPPSPNMVPASQEPSMPAYPATSVPMPALASAPGEMFDDSTRCLNCGQDDHCQNCLRRSRKFWKQTWYPRTAPYCQTGWGWNQPCWRRTVDTYNCPRPQQPPLPRQRARVPEALPDEPAMDAPAYETLPDVAPVGPAPEARLVPRESATRR